MLSSNILNTQETKKNSNKVLTPRVDDILNDEVLQFKDVSFNEEEKERYIEKFIKTTSGKALRYNDVKSVHERIKRIPNLAEITSNSITLMITMHVLPYLEKFYQDEKNRSPYRQVLRTDLFHLFTALLILDGYNKIRIENIIAEGIPIFNVGGSSLTECILNYNMYLALGMASAGLSEIKEKDLSDASELKNSKLLPFKEFFCLEYDPNVHPDEEYFLTYKFGHEGSLLLSCKGQAGDYTFAFIHNVFLDYFSNLTLEVANDRRKVIAQFVEKTSGIEDALSPRSRDPIERVTPKYAERVPTTLPTMMSLPPVVSVVPNSFLNNTSTSKDQLHHAGDTPTSQLRRTTPFS